MAIRTTRTHRQALQVVRDNHFTTGKSRFFDRSYIAENSYGEKWLYPGMIVAEGENEKYVPYSAGGSYGDGSNTAVGVLKTLWDVTYDEYEIEPVVHGALIEQRCFVYGGSLGTVPAAVKTALAQIQWV